jgi:hypothetical protein
MKEGFVLGFSLGLVIALSSLAYWGGYNMGRGTKPDYDIKVLKQGMYLFLENKSGKVFLCQVTGGCRLVASKVD